MGLQDLARYQSRKTHVKVKGSTQSKHVVLLDLVTSL